MLILIFILALMKNAKKIETQYKGIGFSQQQFSLPSLYAIRTHKKFTYTYAHYQIFF